MRPLLWRSVPWVVGAAAGSLVVLLLGIVGSTAALPLGLIMSGLVATGGGVAVLALGRRKQRPQRFRTLLALACLVWGIGQLLLAFEVFSGQADFPTAGKVVSGLAAPFAIAGLALMPRGVTEAMAGLRLLCEVVMLTAGATALVWRLGFSSFLDLGTTDGAIGLALVTAELAIVTLLLSSAAREGNRNVTLVLAGFLLVVAADLVFVHTAAQDQTRPWAAAAVLCMAWPMVIAGVLGVPATPRVPTDLRLVATESRRHVVHATVLVVLAAGMLVSLFLHGPIDLVVVVLYLVLIFASLGREVVRALQAGVLLSRLSHQALVDPLTGLSNRRAMTEHLDDLTRRAADEGARATRVSVLTLDLDRFKDVNGRLGNADGDRLLREVGGQVADRCRSWGASAFRLGGDEFAVLYEAAPDQAMALAEALALVVRAAGASVPGLGPVTLSASIGVAHSASNGGLASSPGVVVVRSTQALQAAKEAGRDRVVAFSPALGARNQRRTAVERRLREQVLRGGVDVHYQPIVILETGVMAGMEALARWTDDELGSVPPQEFIDVAESCGLIDELGWQILRSALEALVISGARDRGMTMAVNVSSHQLRAPEFARQFAALRDELEIPARQVVIEVTESVFVTDDGPAVENLFDMAEAGSPIALDDFGTGYSSLAYLGRLPVRILKLDRTLTARLTEPRTLAIARGVADLARGLDLDVVVEGIETEELRSIAGGLGARFGQGWLYEKAIPLEGLPDLMASMADPVSLDVLLPSAARRAAEVSLPTAGRIGTHRPSPATLPGPRTRPPTADHSGSPG